MKDEREREREREKEERKEYLKWADGLENGNKGVQKQIVSRLSIFDVANY
jgi:hypothetical protein